MKIAILNGYQNSRGVETFVNEITKRLRVNHRVDLVLGDKKVPVRWPYLWRFFLDPHGIYTFTFTLKNLYQIWKNKYDIVIPINGGWQPALIRIVTWLSGGKMVISGQSGVGWDDKNNLWCFPDTFVALSSFAKGWAKRVNPIVKVEYIPNGVDIIKFKSGSGLNLKLKKPIVLTVGALTPEKRIDLTIKAVSKLGNTSLLVVGEGKEKEKLYELGKKMLKGRFQLINLPFNEMPDVYKAADLFSLVSKPQQSFEIVIVEALACNLPVVVNDDPIRKEIVGKAGLLVYPENIDDYAESLKIALNSKWKNKPRDQARKFSWEIIAGKYEQLFKRLSV